MNPAQSEKALATEEAHQVAAALSGDGRAFAALVAPHLDRAFRVAARATGSATLAEDVVQEALVVLHRDLHRYQPGTSLRAFLLGITLRAAVTQRRSERRRTARELATHLDDPFVSPQQAVEAHELAERLQVALDALPARRREAALLRFDGGLDHADIAAALGTTEQAARQLVYEATKALRAALGPQAGMSHVH